MKRREDDANLSCSFCGKSQREVKKLIAGPTVYICDECVSLCNDIIDEELQRENAMAELASPGEAVVLSPACSSYDMFTNFEQRGEAVAVAVEML